MAGCVTDLSREVGGLSHADAEPPKPVPLVATTVPDGGGLTALAGEILRDPRTGKIPLLASGGEEVTFFSEL